MTLQYGINPIVWSNDDMPQLGGDISLQQCLAEAKQAGYRGLELGNKFPRDSAKLKTELEPLELECVSGWHSGYLLERDADEEIKQMQDHLQLLKDMGSSVLIFADLSGGIHGDKSKSLSSRPVMKADHWQEFGQRLSAVAQHCLDHGLKLVYHHHMGTIVQTEKEIDLLMKHTTDAVYLLLDSGHMMFAGGDPLNVAHKHGKRIAHVHCKDIRSEVMQDVLKEDTSFLDAVVRGVFTVPGDGGIDFQGLLTTLHAMRYDEGWLVVEAEQDPEKAPPLEYATKGIEHLKMIVRNVYG